MLHKTKAYVVRTIKYGETSIITTLYTDELGMKTFMIKGARSSRKSGIKANLFEAGQGLEVIAYNNPKKNMQRLKEAKRIPIQSQSSHEFKRRSILQFCTEIILRCIREEESNSDLFQFIDSSFTEIQCVDSSFIANYPIYFLLGFIQKIGFEIDNNYSVDQPIFHLGQGQFRSSSEGDELCVSSQISTAIHQFMSNNDFRSIELNTHLRKEILECLIKYLRLHLESMAEVKSLQVLHDVLS